MLSVKQLLAFRTNNAHALLDVALFLSLVPLLPVLPFLIQLYLVVMLMVIYGTSFQSRRVVSILMGVGAIIIMAIFYGRFSLSGVKTIENVVSFLEVLLVFAILLQRTLRSINIYLFFAPLLLLFLSFFEYNTMVMLIYSQSVLFVYLFMWLWYSTQERFSSTLIMTIRFYLFALPVIVLLFLFFPRISYKKGSYGFSSNVQMRMGHDGTMNLDANTTLNRSKRIVMQVNLSQAVEHPLYFRGSVLYVREALHYYPLDMPSEPLLNTSVPDDALRYDITLYPTNKQWVYQLNTLHKLSMNALSYQSKMVRVAKPIKETLYYQGYSTVSSTIDDPFIDDIQQQVSSMVDEAVALPLSLQRLSRHSDRDKLDALIAYFIRLQLPYTLSPQFKTYSVKAFLEQGGYCVHFSDAFVQMARNMGLMSRIVTGYISKEKNFIAQFGVIREEDAHAWCEVYLRETKQWQRVDPTVFSASKQSSENFLATNKQESWQHKSVLLLQYWQYQINYYLLHYSYSIQKKLLRLANENRMVALQVVALFVVLSALLLIAAILLQRYKEKKDPYLKQILAICTPYLGSKQPSQTLTQYLDALCSEIDPEVIRSLLSAYYAYRFGGVRSTHTLKKRIKLLRNALRKK